MEPLWQSSGPPQPQLHALIIAVADYPHMIDGTGPPAKQQYGLEQVTCPAPTGLRIADWLMKHYRNAHCPLGSIALLLSPPTQFVAGGVPTPVPAATMSNITAAVTGWYQRCDTDPGNIAFFYFVGHGLERVRQYLLPQDFGNPAVIDPWANCIDLVGFVTGMRACRAQTQLFFVDACRQTPFGLLTQVSVKGQSILGGATFADHVATTATYQAAGGGRSAFGPKKGPTYFSDAVVMAFDGCASINNGGVWEVNTASLATTLNQCLPLIGELNKVTLSCQTTVTGSACVSQPGSAAVIVSFDCTSPQASDAAEIRVSQNGRTVTSSAGSAKPLVARLEPGPASVDVVFPNGQYPNRNNWAWTLVPPLVRGVPHP